jgi:hypothetical protein
MNFKNIILSWNKPVTKDHKLYTSFYIKCPEQANLKRQKKVVWCWKSWKITSDCLTSEVSLWVGQSWLWWWLHNYVNTPKSTTDGGTVWYVNYTSIILLEIWSMGRKGLQGFIRHLNCYFSGFCSFVVFISFEVL